MISRPATRSTALVSIALAMLLALPGGIAAAAAPAGPAWEGPWTSSVSARDVDRFVDLWSARVQDKAWFQDFSRAPAVPDRILAEGFHSLDGATRMYLVHRLFDRLQDTVPSFRAEMAALTPAAAQERLRSMQTAMYLALFDKAAWRDAVNHLADGMDRLPILDLPAADASSVDPVLRAGAPVASGLSAVIPPGLQPESLRASPPPAFAAASIPGLDARHVPEAPNRGPAIAAAHPASSPEPLTTAPAPAIAPAEGLPAPVAPEWSATSAPPRPPDRPGQPAPVRTVLAQVEDALPDVGAAAPLVLPQVPALPPLLHGPPLPLGLRDVLDLLREIGAKVLAPGLDVVTPPVPLPKVPDLDPGNPDQFFENLFGQLQPGTLDSLTYLACADTRGVALAKPGTLNCERLPIGVPALKDVDGDGYPDVTIQYVPFLVPDPGNLAGFNGLLILSQPVPGSLTPPPPKLARLQAHLYIVAGLPQTTMRFAMGVDGRGPGNALAPGTTVAFTLRNLANATNGERIDYRFNVTHVEGPPPTPTVVPQILTWGFQRLIYHSPLDNLDGTVADNVTGAEPVQPWWNIAKGVTSGLGSAEPQEIVEGALKLVDAQALVTLDGLIDNTTSGARRFTFQPAVAAQPDARARVTHWQKADLTRRDMSFHVDRLAAQSSIVFTNEPDASFNVAYTASAGTGVLDVGERFNENVPAPSADPGPVNGAVQTAGATLGTAPPPSPPPPVPPATYRDVSSSFHPGPASLSFAFADPNDVSFQGSAAFNDARVDLQAVDAGNFSRSLLWHGFGSVPARVHYVAVPGPESLTITHEASGATTNLDVGLRDVDHHDQAMSAILNGVPTDWSFQAEPQLLELGAGVPSGSDVVNAVAGSYARGTATPLLPLAGQHARLVETGAAANAAARASFAASLLRSFQIDQRTFETLGLDARADSFLDFRAVYDGPGATGDALVSPLPASAHATLQPGILAYLASDPVNSFGFTGSVEASPSRWLAEAAATDVPAHFRVDWVPGLGIASDTVTYDASGVAGFLHARGHRGDEALDATFNATRLSTGMTLGWTGAADGFQLTTRAPADRLDGALRRHLGAESSLAEDHVTFFKQSDAAAVGFGLSRFEAANLSLPLGGDYEVATVPGGQAFAVRASLDGDVTAALNVTNLPTSVASAARQSLKLSVRPEGPALDYTANRAVAGVTASFARASTGEGLNDALTGIPLRVTLDGVTGLSPTITYEASGTLDRMSVAHQGAHTMAFDAVAIALPPWMQMRVAPDLVSFDARAGSSAAAATGVVGSIAARYGSDGLLLPHPAGDHAVLRESGVGASSVARAALAGTLLNLASIGTANDEVHEVVMGQAPRVFALDVNTPTSTVKGVLDAIPSRFTADYAGSVAAFTTTALVTRANFDLDKGANETLFAEVRGLSASSSLNLGLPTLATTPRVTNDAPGGLGGLTVAYQGSANGPRLAIEGSSLAPWMSFDHAADFLRVNAAAAATEEGTGQVGSFVTRYASTGALPNTGLPAEDHATIVQGGGVSSAAFQGTGLRFASIDTAAKEIHARLESGLHGPFNVNFSTPNSTLTGRVSNVPFHLAAAYAGSITDVNADQAVTDLHFDLNKGGGERLEVGLGSLGRDVRIDLGLATLAGAPTVRSFASAPGAGAPLGSLSIHYTASATGPTIFVDATAVPQFLEFHVANDLVSAATGVQPQVGSAPSTVGTLLARYGSDGLFQPGPADDYVVLTQGSATRGSLDIRQLRSAAVNTANDELHAAFLMSAPRNVNLVFNTTTSLLTGRLEGIPASLTLDYANFNVLSASPTPAPREQFRLDPRDGQILAVDASAVPTALNLALGLGALGLDPHLTFDYQAPAAERLGSLAVDYLERPGAARVQANITSVPRANSLHLREDLAEYASRDAAAALDAVGSVALAYGSNETFLSAAPPDHARVRRTAGATLATLGYTGLRQWTLDTRANEVHLLLDANQARSFDLNVEEPSARTSGSVEQAPTHLTIDAVVGDVAIGSSAADTGSLALQFDTHGGFVADAAITGLPASTHLAWTPGGRVDFAARDASAAADALDSILATFSVNGGLLGSRAGDFVVVQKVSNALGLGLGLTNVKDLSFDPVGRTFFNAGLGAAVAHPFSAVASLDNDVDAWVTQTSEPAVTTLTLLPAQSLAYAASGAVNTLTTGWSAQGTRLNADLLANAAPTSVNAHWTVDQAPTFDYDASASVAHLDGFLRQATADGSDTFDLHADALPTWLRVNVSADTLQEDARTSAASAAGSASVGHFDLQYGSAGSFFVTRPSTDHVRLTETAAATVASLLHDGLKFLHADTTLDQLHVGSLNVAPRFLDIGMATLEAVLTLTLDKVQTSLNLDHAGPGTMLLVSESAPMNRAVLSLNKLDAQNQHLRADVIGVPTSLSLVFVPGTPALSWTGSTGSASADAAARFDVGGRVWDLALNHTGVPAQWTFDAAQGRAVFDVPLPQAPMTTAYLALTNHGPGPSFASNHTVVDYSSITGNLDASVRAGAVRRIDYERTAQGLNLDLRMANGFRFDILGDVRVGNSRATASATLNPLPATFQWTQILDNIAFTSAANLDLLASTQVGDAGGISGAGTPPLVRGLSARDGAGPGVRTSLFLEGAPTAFSADAGGRSVHMTAFKPPLPYTLCVNQDCTFVDTRQLTVDADLSVVEPERVTWVGVAKGLPNAISLDFGPFSDTLAGSKRTLHLDYGATAGAGSFAADLRQGSRASHLELSALPTTLAYDLGVGNPTWRAMVTTPAGLERAYGAIRAAAGDPGYAAAVDLRQLPAGAMDLSYGRVTSTSGLNSFGMPGLTYAATGDTLDVTASVDPALFGGDPQAKSSLAATDLVRGASLSLSGNTFQATSPGKTTPNVEAHVWARHTVDQTLTSCTPNCGSTTRAAYAVAAKLAPATIDDLKIKITKFQTSTLQLGFVNSLQGDHETLDYGWNGVNGSFSVAVDLDTQADFGTLGCICDNDAILFNYAGALPPRMLFQVAAQHSTSNGYLWHEDSDLVCTNPNLPYATYDLNIDTNPHPHFWSWDGFSADQSQGGEGGAWIITLDPNDIVPSGAVLTLAAALNPLGGAFTVTTPCA